MRKTCVQPVQEVRLLGGNTVMLSPIPLSSAHMNYAFPHTIRIFPRFIHRLNPQTYTHMLTSVISGLYTESTGLITTITMYIKSNEEIKKLVNEQGAF
jgi:hypothetical protein